MADKQATTLRLSPPYMADKVDLRVMVGADPAGPEEESEFVLYPPGSPVAPYNLRKEGRTVVTIADPEVAMALRTDPTMVFHVVGTDQEKAAAERELTFRPLRVPEPVFYVPAETVGTATTPTVEYAPAAERDAATIRAEVKAEQEAIRKQAEKNKES